jgi:hypothetical protein
VNGIIIRLKSPISILIKMITLLVDEAYAFDYMAILEIKAKQMGSQNQSERLSECQNHIKQQISLELWEAIISSTEYKDLVTINEKVFWAVEQARYGSISAKEVDSANMERFFCKQRLQNKFFVSSTTETKT